MIVSWKQGGKTGLARMVYNIIMDIVDIKSWLEDAISLLENNSKDTIPERVQENRRRWGAPFRKRDEIKAWVQANKPNALPYLAELKNWLEAYYHYFDRGYISEWSIDDLPDMIKERLIFIREKIENL